MTAIRLALAQFAPRLGDVEFNRKKIGELARKAQGADVLVLPELAFTGYLFLDHAHAVSVAEPATLKSESIRLLAQLAKDHGLTIVSGFCERTELGAERLYNSAVVIGPDGPLGVYRKTHLFNTEKEIFEPGDTGFKVWDVPLRDGGQAKLGVMVCFDWYFVESWRTLQLMGAEVIANAANLVLPGRCQRSVPVLSMMHRVATVLANRFGTERNITFTGESLMAGPNGEELVRAGVAEERVLTAAVELDQVRAKQITPRNHLLADRRPEFYGPVVDEAAREKIARLEHERRQAAIDPLARPKSVGFVGPM